jgi:hypothetical protein
LSRAIQIADENWHPGHILSTVEEYEPGLEDLDVEAKGKLATLWGKMKSR